MFLSPVIKQRLALSARRCNRIAGKCTDVACPGIGNLEPCQQNGNHGQDCRQGNGKFRAYGSALIDFKNARCTG